MRLIRSAFDSMKEAVFIRDSEYRIVKMNAAARRFLKERSPKRTKAVRCYEILKRRSMPCPDCPAEHSLRTGQSAIREYHETGSDRWYETRTSALADEKGNPTSVVEILLDITSRKRAEKKSRMLGQVVEAMGEGVAIWDLSGRILLVNRAMCDSLGYEKEELEGASLDLIRSESAPRALYDEIMMSTLEGGWAGEVLNRRKAGGEFPVLLTTTPLHNGDGNACAIIGVMRDMTERKRMEEHLLRTKKLASIGTLAHGVAHEFNNILAGIKGYAQLALMNSDGGGSLGKALRVINDLSERGKELVESLALFSQGREPSLGLVNFRRLVAEILKLHESQFQKDNIRLKRLLRTVPDVFADGDQIRTVLNQLIENARHAILPKKAGTITVETGADDGTVFARVADTGIGMIEEEREKVFDPFFTTKGALGGAIYDGKLHGTGLGLSLAFGIVENHGGTLSVESRPDAGTTFTLSLPRAVERRSAAPTAPSPPVDETLRAPAERSALVVDDEESMIGLLTDALRLWGYRVTAVDDGEKAVLECLRKPYGVVLMDYLMPGMNGDEAFRMIRKARPSTPVLFITGWNDLAKAETMLSEGTEGWILKPFDLREVRKKIDAVFQNRLERLSH